MFLFSFSSNNEEDDYENEKTEEGADGDDEPFGDDPEGDVLGDFLALLSVGCFEGRVEFADWDIPEVRDIGFPHCVEFPPALGEDASFFRIYVETFDGVSAPIGDGDIARRARVDRAGISEEEGEGDGRRPEEPGRREFFDAHFLANVARDAHKEEAPDHGGEGDLRLLVFVFGRFGAEEDDAVVTARLGVVRHLDAEAEFDDLFGEDRDFGGIEGDPVGDREARAALERRRPDFILGFATITGRGEVSRGGIELDQVLGGIGNLDGMRRFFARLQCHFK